MRSTGYNVEEHDLTTDDGYILTVHRMPGSPKSPIGPNKPVVLLIHGLLAASDVWVLRGPDKDLGIFTFFVFYPTHTFFIFSLIIHVFLFSPSLHCPAYMMVDAGYDVWLLNTRGNFYARRHKKLQPKEEKFWRFR